MDSALAEMWSWVDGSHGLRTHILETLTDGDLAFSPGGQNMTRGALCREMGEIEHSYIQSFKTFTQDFSYHAPDPTVAQGVAQLRAWYSTLDEELKATLEALSDADLGQDHRPRRLPGAPGDTARHLPASPVDLLRQGDDLPQGDEQAAAGHGAGVDRVGVFTPQVGASSWQAEP